MQRRQYMNTATYYMMPTPSMVDCNEWQLLECDTVECNMVMENSASKVYYTYYQYMFQNTS